MSFLWQAVIDKADLLEAIGFVRTRGGLRVKGIHLEADVDIMASNQGFSFRTAHISYDCPADRLSDEPFEGPVQGGGAEAFEGGHEPGKLTRPCSGAGRTVV